MSTVVLWHGRDQLLAHLVGRRRYATPDGSRNIGGASAESEPEALAGASAT